MQEQMKAVVAGVAALLSVLVAYAVSGELDAVTLETAIQAVASAAITYAVVYFTRNRPSGE